MSRLDDGFSTTYTFALAPDVKFYEKTVTPPALSAGGANDTTTMRNIRFRTNSPKKLITVGESSASVAYDPAVYDDILAMLGENQLITINFPEGDKYAYWGWIDNFQPAAAQEGSQPTADLTIIASNQDDTGAETEPVYTPPPAPPTA